MEPINYLAQVADPFAQALQGVKIGAGLADLEAQRALQARQQQQQQLALQEQAKFFSNPNPTMRDAAKYASLLTPDQSKAFLPFMEGISKEQQQNTLKTTGQLLAALQTNPQVFITKAKENALAASNSGDMEDSAFFEQMAEAAADPERGPAVVFKSLAVRTAGIPGAKEFFENIDKSLSTARAEELASSVKSKSVAEANAAVADAEKKVAEAKDTPARLKAEQELRVAQADKAKADAATAKVTSEFAQRKELAALNLNEAQIANYATQQDIARQNARIAAMQADAAKESNALKRQELQLKIDTAQEARDQSVRDKYSQAQNVLGTFDSTLVAVDKILNNWGKTKDGKVDPNLSNSTVKSATGPVQSRIFTTGQDVADFEEQVASLESQAFLSQVEKMRGLGALTEREGARLVNALASLSLRQSPKQLAENMLVVRDLMQKARDSAAAKYGNLQSEPTPPSATPTPAAATVPVMPSGFRVVR